MLEYLRGIKNDNYDCISFLEGEEEESIVIRGSHYSNPGEKVPPGYMGDIYHIVLFRECREDPQKYDDFEQFDGVLVEPLEYISRMITQGWYGVVAKKTTTSGKFIEKMVDMFNIEVYNTQ